MTENVKKAGIGKADILAVILLLLFPLFMKVALWLPLADQPVHFGGDAVELMYPWIQTTVDAWHEGPLPVYTPYEGLGRPLHTNLQAAVFYPGTWLLTLIFSGGISYSLFQFYFLLHLSIAAIGTYILARTLSIKPLAAAIAGMIFVAGGFFLNHVSILSMLASAAWVPWVIAFSLLAFRMGGYRWLFPASVFVALSVLGGLPQPAYYGLAFIGIAAVWTAVASRSIRPLIALVVILLLAFALAAPALLPGIWELDNLQRGAAARKMMDNPALLGERFVALLAPQAGHNLSMAFSLFAGTGTFILAVIGLGSRELRRKWLLITGLAFFLLIAFANVLGVDGLFATVVPGYKIFKEHERAGVMVNLLLAILAAAGVQQLFKAELRAGLRIVAISSAIVALGFQAWAFLFRSDITFQGSFALQTILFSSVAVVFILLFSPVKSRPAVLITVVIAVCLAELLVLSNTNNLHKGVQEKITYRREQADAIPRGIVPSRVTRGSSNIHSTMDILFGLNTFYSGDTNQYIDLLRFWTTVKQNPAIALMFNVQYAILPNVLPEKPRSLSEFTLNQSNRLQVFKLLQVKASEISISILAKTNDMDQAALSAAVRTNSGKVQEFSLENSREDMEEDTIARRFNGTLALEQPFVPSALFVRLDTGNSASVDRFEIDGEEAFVIPEFTVLKEQVYRFNDALPRAYLVPSAMFYETNRQIEKAMRKGTIDLQEQVLLLNDQAENESGVIWQAGDFASAGSEIVEYSRNSVVIDVDTPTDAYLVISDYYHRGWHASVDDEPAPILKANYLVRAVRLSKGQHRISFQFNDDLVWIGMILTALALVAGVVLTIGRRK